ncbi:hypothetical protein [Actinocorallia lasiicapitis]
MALAVALVVVGGIALVSSLNSKSEKPGAAASQAESGETKPMAAESSSKYIILKVDGKAQILAQSPDHGMIYLQGFYTEDRALSALDLDLTIYTPAKVGLLVNGKPVSLQAEGPVNLQFRDGKLTSKN